MYGWIRIARLISPAFSATEATNERIFVIPSAKRFPQYRRQALPGRPAPRAVIRRTSDVSPRSYGGAIPSATTTSFLLPEIRGRDNSHDMTKGANVLVAVVAIATSRWAVAASPSTAELDSKRSAFHWRLPTGWVFAEADRAVLNLPNEGAADVVVARAKGKYGPMALLIVTDMAGYPGEVVHSVSEDSEQYGRTKLGMFGASDIRTETVSISGIRTVRVSGVAQKLAPRPFRSVAVVRMGSRQFELLCSARPSSTAKGDPCGPVLPGLTLRPRDDQPTENPRPLRLRGEAFGIHYDPPDGRWIGIGPRLGMGGAQKLWVWMLNGGDQIDVQGIDVSVFAAYPDAKEMAEGYATKVRSEGATTSIGTESNGGLTWTHLQVTRKAGGKQEDMFIYRVKNTVYTVHVLQATRDPSLVRRALAGFSLAR
jgi:hypothetical protein